MSNKIKFFIGSRAEELEIVRHTLQTNGIEPTIVNDRIGITVEQALTEIDDTNVMGLVSKNLAINRHGVVEIMKVEHPEWFEWMGKQ